MVKKNKMITLEEDIHEKVSKEGNASFFIETLLRKHYESEDTTPEERTALLEDSDITEDEIDFFNHRRYDDLKNLKINYCDKFKIALKIIPILKKQRSAFKILNYAIRGLDGNLGTN